MDNCIILPVPLPLVHVNFKLATLQTRAGGEGSWLSSKVGSGNRPRAFARALISLLLAQDHPRSFAHRVHGGWRDRHAGRGGFPHQSNLRRGQAVGLVDEVAEDARSRFKVSAARARAGSMVRVYSSRNAWTPAEVSGSFLPRTRFTSPTQMSESRSVRARSLLLGFSTPYSTRNQSSNVRSVC